MSTQPILAIDVGGRHYGFAIYLPGEGIARRLQTVATDVVDEVIQTILTLITQHGIVTVVVGYPRNLDGEPTAQTDATNEFCEQLAEVLPAGVELVRVDETLTSREAAANLLAQGASPDDEHAEAARIILADYLNR